ncbi:hypothetical protein [Corynebacterium provencense]|uniref:hypothetical protein n=1 Tax=Corynebacterium provencense TaxID=1737425 RepID=UPI000B02ED4F|nr:hypothetical protein [Corynebacterium provencense]
MTDPVHDIVPEPRDFLVRFEVPVCCLHRDDAVTCALQTINDDHLLEVIEQ